MFSNTPKSYKALLLWIDKYLQARCCFLCFENTGHNSTNLSVYLSENTIDYVEENPLAIKRSMGIVKGKTDPLNAGRIARSAWFHKEELVLSTPKEQDIQELGRVIL